MFRIAVGITLVVCGATSACAVGDGGALFDAKDREDTEPVAPELGAVRAPHAIEVAETSSDPGEGGKRPDGPACFDGDARTTDAVCGWNARGRAIVTCSEGGWVDGGCADPDVCEDGDEHPGVTACGERGLVPRSCVRGKWAEQSRCVEPPACDCPSSDACRSEACDANATCQIVIGDPVCVCDAGYEGSGALCVDINECAKSPCGANEVCANEIGGFRCACADGYRSTEAGCVDIDECLDDPCHLEASCDNMDGTYICTCPPGFAGDGHVCFDPCDLHPCAQHATCTSSIQGVACTCDDGYVGDGLVSCFLD